jgi:signal transduction histidine kinase
MYLLLAGFIQQASDTIARQELSLRTQVAQLTDLLEQNAELHERVRRAATRTTALNERVLRRISAELHDGPAQELGLALLRLDHISQPCASARAQASFRRRIHWM